MVNFQNKKIFYTLKEYQNNYNILLKEYLNQHEDFDELMFLEIEMQFYSLCYDNSNLEIGDYGYGPQYCINGGYCELLIPEINEAISLGDSYNFELSTKYNTSFSKILQFLIDKKNNTSIAEKNIYNPILNSCGSPEIKDLFINILHNNLSLFSTINQIKSITTSDTYDLFLNEFNSVYNHLICEFMFSFKEDVILDAIDTYENNLSFVYLSEGEISKVKTFIRDIGKYKTVYNAFGFSPVEKENSTKFIHLNNLMIDYCNDFFHAPIDGFEYLISLKKVYEHLNKSKEDNVSVSNNANSEKSKEPKVDITYIDGIFLDNKNILPISILNAYNNIGNFEHLYLNEKDDEILNSYDLGPFDSLPGETIIEYYCIEENYLNLLSKIEDKTYIFLDNRPLELYLYEYAKAFQKGYIDFEKNLNQKQTTIEEPQEQKALKIFSYVLNAKYKNGYFGDITENHEAIKDRKGRYISNDEFIEWGFQGGQYYKAWEIILSNPLVFEPFFLKYYSSTVTNNIIASKVLEDKNTKKFPAKYQALTYILELLAEGKKPPQDFDGNFKKDEIIKIGKDRCNNSGQSFYNFVKDHFGLISSKKIKISVFRNNWKEIVLEITINKKEVELYIKDNNL
ncbi:hypothetical protein [Flavobacterium sp.]|uniref:hypothetical protein n=1 Tax=Flavobacterium sp. TaxID=239 RepID=UPI00286D7BEC|nr:hypothetical protein [Flavobacterium sp.]